YLKELFTKELKAECTTDNYGNLIVKIPAKNTTRREPVLFGVHADTVKPGKNIEPVLKDGIIRSKGETILGADDKAGIAELFEAIRTAEQYPPLEIVVSREEEVGLRGSKNIDVSLLKSKTGFLIDMDTLKDIVIGGPSYMSIDVDVTGKAAHAGMEPEKGISSIKAASYAISMLKEGWIDKETTVNVGIIKGGQVLNAVPEKTEVKIECRSQSHEKCLRQSNLIKEVFLTAAKSIGAKAEVKMELSIKASRISEDAEVVKVARRAVSSVGLKPSVRVICGGTDASNYNEKGIETVVIGMGAKGEHTKEENIAVVDMEKAVDIIQHIFKELSGKE
ncbi:MAG: M20/M25/M40 family metallo-hydrolase, partial [Candidatus Aerophobetes bacterium]|nr:M20/M25/M40 family metallo-hydrolase [Candidatus Aerophobetes bacterium]